MVGMYMYQLRCIKHAQPSVEVYKEAGTKKMVGWRRTNHKEGRRSNYMIAV